MLTTELTYDQATRVVTVADTFGPQPGITEYHLCNRRPDGSEQVLVVSKDGTGIVSYKIPQDGLYRLVLRTVTLPTDATYTDAGPVVFLHVSDYLNDLADQAYISHCRAAKRPAGNPLHTVFWLDLRLQESRITFREGNYSLAETLLATNY